MHADQEEVDTVCIEVTLQLQSRCFYHIRIFANIHSRCFYHIRIFANIHSQKCTVAHNYMGHSHCDTKVNYTDMCIGDTGVTAYKN